MNQLSNTVPSGTDSFSGCRRPGPETGSDSSRAGQGCPCAGLSAAASEEPARTRLLPGSAQRERRRLGHRGRSATTRHSPAGHRPVPDGSQGKVVSGASRRWLGQSFRISFQ